MTKIKVTFTAFARNFSLFLYLVKYIKMDYDGTIGRRGLPMLIDGAACYATSKESDGSLFVHHNSLYFIVQTVVNKSDSAGIFLNKYLEIRENRVNTHTHTQGLARQYTANYLTYKELAGFFHFPQAIFIKEHRPTHTVSPPRGNVQAETFIYPRNRVTHVNAVPAGFRGFLYPTAN